MGRKKVLTPRQWNARQRQWKKFHEWETRYSDDDPFAARLSKVSDLYDLYSSAHPGTFPGPPLSSVEETGRHVVALHHALSHLSSAL